MNGKTRQATGVFGFVLAMALGVMLALGSASNTALAEQECAGLGESLEDSGIVLSMADDADALTVDSELEDGLELVRSDEGEAITVEPQSDEDSPLEAQAAAAHVSYRTHVQSYGWQGLVRDGEVAGTSGRAKRLEGIELKLTGAPYAGGITYRTHVQGIGWQGWKSNGQTSGTSGQARRLEAIEIKLTGTMAQKYDVWYRVHAQTYGWMGWARNGARAGTEGWAKRLEAIEVRITAKGSAAPGSTVNAFRKPTKVTASYESLYGPTLRSAASAARSIKGPGKEYKYFLYDINHDGVAEMIIGDKAVGGSTGNAYTIVGDGGRLSVVSLGTIGTGFRDSYRVNGGRFYRSHQYSGSVYVDYLVTISDRRIVEQQIGGITQGRPGVTGTLIGGYNIYTDKNKEYKPSIDYAGLRGAGSVTLLV